jgi:hypothetical protein
VASAQDAGSGVVHHQSEQKPSEDQQQDYVPHLPRCRTCQESGGMLNRRGSLIACRALYGSWKTSGNSHATDSSIAEAMLKRTRDGQLDWYLKLQKTFAPRPCWSAHATLLLHRVAEASISFCTKTNLKNTTKVIGDRQRHPMLNGIL